MTENNHFLDEQEIEFRKIHKAIEHLLVKVLEYNSQEYLDNGTRTIVYTKGDVYISVTDGYLDDEEML